MAKVSTWTLYKLHKLLIFCGSLLLNTSDFLKAFTAFCTETSQLSAISILTISFFKVFDPYTDTTAQCISVYFTYEGGSFGYSVVYFSLGHLLSTYLAVSKLLFFVSRHQSMVYSSAV